MKAVAELEECLPLLGAICTMLAVVERYLGIHTVGCCKDFNCFDVGCFHMF